jgi:hypothetical protein
MINMTNELNDAHKKFLEDEIMNNLIILMEKLQEMVKWNVQNELNIKISQIKNLRKHRSR